MGGTSFPLLLLRNRNFDWLMGLKLLLAKFDPLLALFSGIFGVLSVFLFSNVQGPGDCDQDDSLGSVS
jgi:hypothetical protein